MRRECPRGHKHRPVLNAVLRLFRFLARRDRQLPYMGSKIFKNRT